MTGKVVAHLSISWHNVFKEGNMPNHVLKTIAVVKVVEYDTKASQIFADYLNATVLDTIIIHNECAHVNC